MGINKLINVGDLDFLKSIWLDFTFNRIDMKYFGSFFSGFRVKLEN